MKKYAHYNIEQYREKGEDDIEAKWTHQDKMAMVHMLDDMARKIEEVEKKINFTMESISKEQKDIFNHPVGVSTLKDIYDNQKS